MKKEVRILSLDGGGSKGVYTLGVLKELEKMLGGKLYEHFDIIYGTSTGSIIAALLGLGHDVEFIKTNYFKLIPEIMGGTNGSEKSAKLKKKADEIFGDKLFTEFKTDVGIVSMNYEDQKPFVFKTNSKYAHGMKGTFAPGFGCKISDAVQASCAAYPLFEIKKIDTQNQGIINAIDGGFIANNPVLFALIDANKAANYHEEEIKLLSIGVGRFIEKPLGWKYKIIMKFKMAQLAERVMSANSITNEILVKLLYPNLHYIRINDTYAQPEYGTNMVEVDLVKLNKMAQLGRDSFAKHERDISVLMQNK